MMTMQRLERTNLARRLQENGVPLGGGGTLQTDVLLMRQIGEPWESRAFDLGNMAAGYMVQCNILLLSNNISLENIYLELPWVDWSISLLTDPLERCAGFDDYRFYRGGGKNPISIDRADVLNHQLLNKDLLSRRTPFQGLLLWSGMEEIPHAFNHRGELPATVTFVDQFCGAHPFRVNLRIDRRNKWSPRKHTKRARVPLFEQRDPDPVHSGSRKATNEVKMVGVRELCLQQMCERRSK